LLDSIQLAIKESKEKVPRQIPKEYEISNTSWRVVKLIIGTAKLISKWENINLDHSKIKSFDCKNSSHDFGN
jgi:UDP-N-acetylglucosamine 2-epimerase (non-hydrolysing)